MQNQSNSLISRWRCPGNLKTKIRNSEIHSFQSDTIIFFKTKSNKIVGRHYFLWFKVILSRSGSSVSLDGHGFSFTDAVDFVFLGCSYLYEVQNEVHNNSSLEIYYQVSSAYRIGLSIHNGLQ